MKATLIELPTGDWVLPSSIQFIKLGFLDDAQTKPCVVVGHRTDEPAIPVETVFTSGIRIPVETAKDGLVLIRQIVQDMGITVQVPKKPVKSKI